MIAIPNKSSGRSTLSDCSGAFGILQIISSTPLIHPSNTRYPATIDHTPNPENAMDTDTAADATAALISTRASLPNCIFRRIHAR